MNKQRIIEFDFIRGFCMIYIVGVWHLNNYLSVDMQYGNEVFVYLKNAVLATFTFISGYMLRKYEFGSGCDIIHFYKKRVLRFYPLFILSALSLFVMQWMDIKQLLYGISGLAMFTDAPVKTLWYISMLMFLYAITPIMRLKKLNKMRYGKLFVFCLVLVVLIILYRKEIIDERLMRYMPIYVLGLYVKDLNFNKKQWMSIGLGSLIFIVGFWLIHIDRVIFSCIVAFWGAASLIAIGFLLPVKRFYGPINFFAYSSMTAYLFHRQIFGIALWLLGVRGFGEPYLPLFIAIITLVLLFLSSWLMQFIYDRLISHLCNKKM